MKYIFLFLSPFLLLSTANANSHAFDEKLIGEWYMNFFLTASIEFGDDSTAQFTNGAGGVTYLVYKAAIAFDNTSTQKRFTQTITEVVYEIGGESEDSIPIGAQKWCIYDIKMNTLLQLHCKNEGGFPENFNVPVDDKLVFKRVN